MNGRRRKRSVWLAGGGILSLSLLMALAFSPAAEARSNLTTPCLTCHDGTTATDFTTIDVCNGCHAHGVYADGASRDAGGPLNLIATTDLTSYQETDTITVSLEGGYKNGNARMMVFHPTSGTELARAFGSIDAGVPLSVDVPASAIGAGTFALPVAWFGSAFNATGDPVDIHMQEQVFTATITIEAICVPSGPEDLLTPGSCSDGIDNDCDGAIDGLDPGCIAGCTDMDGDGFAIEGGACGLVDCNDMDNTIYPGAPESCNGIDDNCDGAIDEGVLLTFYADADADTYGDPAVMTMACDPPMGYVADNTDCDDTNNAINPGAPEICEGGIDEDCDGLIDGMDPDCGAHVLPPPVSQDIGIPDSTFNDLAEDDCRFCHALPGEFPPGIPVEMTYLPSRHHGLVGSTIPDPTAAPYSSPGATYECLSCHTFTYNPVTGTDEIDPNFRDCTVCHVQVGGFTVHHATTLAQEGSCTSCHSYIDDPTDTFTTTASDPANAGDAHYVPTYKPSMVTPWPSSKPNGDPDTVSPITTMPDGTTFGGKEAGNCNFCHDASITGTLKDGVLVYTNRQTHHSTGFRDFGTQTQCDWCHNDNDPAPPMTGGAQFANTPEYAIRACQRCHSVSTIHSIQLDSDNPANIGTIDPGAETPGFGHIGDQWDCWGCHGNDGVEMATAPSGPIFPAISEVSASLLPAGVATQITLTGESFTNVVQTNEGIIEQVSQVLLTDAAGNATLLAADSVSVNELVVTIPALPAGNYTLVAKKFLNESNPVVLAIIPAVAIESASCADGTVTIAGSGFSGYDGHNAVTKVSSTVSTTTSTEVLVGYDKKGRPIYETVTETVTETTDGDILSWTDSEIVAAFPSCGATIDVASVFGNASADVTSDGGEPSGSCADYSDETSCTDDPTCAWSVNKKGVGSCEDASSDGGGNGGGKNK